MLRSVVAIGLVSLGALSLAREPGCGGADLGSGGLNGPCTRSKDCATGLVCAEGVCTEPDAGLGGVDSGRDATLGGDAPDDGD